MKNRFITRAVALVVVLSVVVALAAAPAPERDHFKGKIVVVTYTEGHNTLKASLEKVRLQKFGERYYIVGRAVDSGFTRFTIGDCTLWVPEGNVMSIAEYESIQKVPNTELGAMGKELPPAMRKLEPAKGKPLPPKQIEEKKLIDSGKR